jgi:hypothetical protein
MTPTETAVSRMSSRSGHNRRVARENSAVAAAMTWAKTESAMVKSPPRGPCPSPKK